MSTDLQVQPAWLTALREAGKAGFTGLPTQRQEAWKYTGLNKLKALTFEPTPSQSASPLEGEVGPKVRVGGTVSTLAMLVRRRRRLERQRLQLIQSGIFPGLLALGRQAGEACLAGFAQRRQPAGLDLQIGAHAACPSANSA